MGDRDDARTAMLVIAGFAVGLGVPDLDFLLPFGHRSALTHSVLPLLLVMLLAEGRRLATGVALGIGIHLSADSFPNAMTGFALVKLPFAGALSAGQSYVWLGRTRCWRLRSARRRRSACCPAPSRSAC